MLLLTEKIFVGFIECSTKGHTRYKRINISGRESSRNESCVFLTRRWSSFLVQICSVLFQSAVETSWAGQNTRRGLPESLSKNHPLHDFHKYLTQKAQNQQILLRMTVPALSLPLVQKSRGFPNTNTKTMIFYSPPLLPFSWHNEF